jgi:phosphatidylinositol alpha-1,6-mannosyltransferase
LEYVVFAYGYEFEKVRKSFFMRYLYVNIYSRARSVICCSEEVKRRLAVFGVPARNIEVLYPAVDLDRYQPRPVPARFLEEKGIAGKKVLLTVGRLVERKGHDRVIAALPKISREFPETIYCVVGIGPHEQALREASRRHGVESRVRFLGKLGSDDLVLMYNAADIFLMPSREISGGGHIEGFGIVFLEANACAKPVIGGNSGGVLEAIRAGETGFIVDPESPDEIADRVLELLRDPARARDMGRAGLRWAREEFDWNGYVERSYEALMGKKLK